MTYTEERVAAERGRVLLALYRAGMQVRVWPDAMSGRAGPQSATGAGDSPLQAIYAAVERLNERAGVIVVPID